MAFKGLVTVEDLEKLPYLYETEKVPVGEKVPVLKFFGGGRGTWYAVEAACLFDEDDTRHVPREVADLIESASDVLFFGYVVSPLGPDCDEWGNFSLAELAELRFPPFGLPIERDLYFSPAPMKTLVPNLRGGD